MRERSYSLLAKLNGLNHESLDTFVRISGIDQHVSVLRECYYARMNIVCISVLMIKAIRERSVAVFDAKTILSFG